MTYQQAIDELPATARWSCSFGYPGVPGYVEYWRDSESKRRWNICNGTFADTWRINQIGDAR